MNKRLTGLNKYFCFKDKEFYKITIRLMLPIILQQMISIGINFFDNIMIGGLGEAAISAASISNQFYSIFQFICTGLGAGASVLTAQYWGRRDREKIRVGAAIAFQMTLILCAIFSILSLVFPDVVIKLLTNQPAIIEEGIPYLRLLGTTFILTGISATAAYLLRSTGLVKIPLMGSGIAFLTNIFFNWVFIFGKLGAPKMDLRGAAVGTIIARVVEFLIIFIYFIFKDQNIGFRFRHFFSKGGGLWGTYFKYALPVLGGDFLLGLSLIIASGIFGHAGAEIAAASSMINSLIQLTTMVCYGIAGAAAVIIGNTIGSGEIEKAKRQGNTYIVLTFVLALFLIPILLLIEQPYFSIYTVSSFTLEIAHGIMIINCVFVPFQVLAFMLTRGVMRGAGDTKFLFVADNVLIWFISLPLGFLAAFVWGMNPVWIYFFIRVEYPLKALICLPRYLSGKWIKRI